MTEITIYTDGACSSNPGPGGWGAVLKSGKHEKEIYGSDPDTTNNKMELTAAIKALSAIKKTSVVTLYTDSVYVKDGITKWIYNWKKNNWKTAKKQPVKNVDLWKELDKEIQRHEIKWKWVKGHSGNEGNERADALATKGVEEAKLNLQTTN